jgi:hypothetical protein
LSSQTATISVSIFSFFRLTVFNFNIFYLPIHIGEFLIFESDFTL